MNFPLTLQYISIKCLFVFFGCTAVNGSSSKKDGVKIIAIVIPTIIGVIVLLCLMLICVYRKRKLSKGNYIYILCRN